VSVDCDRCPYRQIGTTGIEYERAFQKGELPKLVIEVNGQVVQEEDDEAD
jgi:hypothetical protein